MLVYRDFVAFCVGRYFHTCFLCFLDLYLDNVDTLRSVFLLL